MNSTVVFNVLVGLFALLAIWFVARSVRAFRRRRTAGGVFGVASALVSALIAVCLMLMSLGLNGFSRLTYERTAAEVAFAKSGERAYVATVRYADGRKVDYPLSGDEWQIDARMMTFKPLAVMLGFDSIYRLERIGGRYRSVEDENRLPRTVHALQSEPAIDLWEAARRAHAWAPWLDAYYGNATYVPMADGAQYAVSVSQTGVRARPMNAAARKAVEGWR